MKEVKSIIPILRREKPRLRPCNYITCQRFQLTGGRVRTADPAARRLLLTAEPAAPKY